MANTLVTSNASSWLGGMSGKAAKDLESRAEKLKRQERKAMGMETEEDKRIEREGKAKK